MSLHDAARHIADKGRGSDTTLVHMSKREVQGLQALAKAKGGTLTVNPHTGLPEAGFLEDILPMVAAGAAIYFTAGAATPMVASATGLGMTGAGILAGAGAGALISGGMAAIQGKDIGNAALMGGVMGGIGGGIGAPGEAPVPGAGDTVGALKPDLPPPNVNSSVGLNANIPVQASNNLLTAPSQINPTTGQLLDPMTKGLQGAPVPAGGYSGFTGPQAVPGPNTPISALTPTANTINSALPGQNLMPGVISPSTGSALPSTPDVSQLSPADAMRKTQQDAVDAALKDPKSSWWAKQTPWEKAGYSTAGAALLGEMANRANTKAPNFQNTASTGDYGNIRRISPDFQAQAPIQPDPYYRARYPVYASVGGLMDLAGGGVPEADDEYGSDNGASGMIAAMSNGGDVTKKKQRASLTADRTIASLDPMNAALAEMNNARYGANMGPTVSSRSGIKALGELPIVAGAGGGLSSLGGYSDGGRLLKGPGDGMSDNIPAQIGRKQPARLADGEFVVPADVVSHLGNGSTDAGAKRLYAMMDKVRQARTGKKKQAPAVNTARFLPA